MKALCMAKWGHTFKSFIIIIIIIISIIIIIIAVVIIITILLLLLIIIIIIIIETLSYLLKTNKRTNKKYLRDSNFVMHFY